MSWMTAQEVDSQVAAELLEMGTTLHRVCQKWAAKVADGTIPYDDLFINEKTALKAIRGRVRKLVREVDAKVDEAIAGTYDRRSDVGNGGSKTDD